MPSITGDEFSCFGRLFLNRKELSPHLVQRSRISVAAAPLNRRCSDMFRGAFAVHVAALL